MLNPDPESDSEDSEDDGPDEPVIPSPEMDDVKGESFNSLPVEQLGRPLLGKGKITTLRAQLCLTYFT